MKKVILASLLLMLIQLSYSQKYEFIGGLKSNISLYSEEFSPYEFSADFGYFIFNRVFLSAYAESSVGIFNQNNIKTHSTDGTFGGGLGYRFITTNKFSIDARGKFGSTISNKDWSYKYYDLGFLCNIGNQAAKPSWGIGVRYYDSSNSIFSDYLRIYMSVGFTIN